MAPRKKAKHSAKPRDTYVSDPDLCFIQHLPFEILSYIFKIAEEDYREEHGPRILTQWTHAYRFCRVNSVWRSVALQTLELWTCINVHGARSLRRGKSWLEHAGRRGLDVSLVTKAPNASLDVVMAVFGPHMDHMESLMIDISNEHFSRNTSFFWRNGVTSIRNLELKVLFETVSQAADVLRSCPQLQELNMAACLVLDWTPSDAPTPSIHLPQLAMAYLSSGDLMLSLVPLLRIPEDTKVSFDGDRANTLLVNYFDYRILAADDLFRCLRNLPQMKALSFEYITWANHVVDFVCTPNDDGFFPCPRLQTLEFHSCPDFGGSLMQFESRYRGVEGRACTLPPPLKRAVFDTCPFLQDHNQAKRMFREFGTAFAFYNDPGLDSSFDIEWESDVRSEDDEWGYDQAEADEGLESSDEGTKEDYKAGSVETREEIEGPRPPSSYDET